MSNPELTIINDDTQPYLPLPIPGSEGMYFKVLKADERHNRVVMKFKFDADTRLPRHVHHCRAIAYTIAGEWEYDEGAFKTGHVAYEEVGNDHTPLSNTGAELFLFFDSDDGRFLDNYLECGTVLRLGMSFFKAYEGVSAEEAANINPEEVIEIIPPEVS